MQPEWFKSWFDSPYYKLLYRHRDEHEADAFVRKLLNELKLEKGAAILDMPCGNGRHAVVMASMGYTITGADLSERNIREALENKNPLLHFIEHDMREPLPITQFDGVMNLFTSLGYFKTEAENVSVMKSISDSLKPNGILVIDFFNCDCVEENLKCADSVQIDDVQFTIERKIENKKVLKRIHITHGEKQFDFEERVQLLELTDFEKFYSPFGLVTEKLFGDYQLNPFTVNSERLIIIARKKK